MRSPRSSSVTRNGWPSTRLSTSRSASSGSPPSMSRAICATAVSSSGPSRISDAPADSSRPTASCAASGSSPGRSASSQLIWWVASRLDSMTRALAVAASAHCRSSRTTSSGARRAACSSASCSSRSSQNRWSGDWLSSCSRAGSTGGSSAETRASRIGPSGTARAAGSPPPENVAIPWSAARRTASASSVVLPTPAGPVTITTLPCPARSAFSCPRSTSTWGCRLCNLGGTRPS